MISSLKRGFQRAPHALENPPLISNYEGSCVPQGSDKRAPLAVGNLSIQEMVLPVRTCQL